MSSAPPLGLVDRLVANAVLETTVDQAHTADTFSKCSRNNFQSIFPFIDLRGSHNFISCRIKLTPAAL